MFARSFNVKTGVAPPKWSVSKKSKSKSLSAGCGERVFCARRGAFVSI